MRGMYAEQLRWVYRNFDHQNVLVMESEKVFKGSNETIARILNFLGLPETKIKRPKKSVYSFRPSLVGNNTKRNQASESSQLFFLACLTIDGA